MLAARNIIDNFECAKETTVKANLKVYKDTRVQKKAKRKRALQVDVFVCALALMVMALVYTSLEAQITAVGYDINKLKTEISSVENANSRLMLSIEELSSPESIANYAKTQVGLVEAGEDNTIYQNMHSVNVASLRDVSSMSTVAADIAEGTVEVLDNSPSHPVFDALVGLINNFKSDDNGQQVGQANVGEAKVEVIK